MSVNVYDPVNDRLIPVAGATLFADAPVGSIIAFAGKEINLPEGYLAFNGQTVKRSDYPDLWAFAVANEQVGVDKFFSQGDGSTTFTLADLRETSLKGYGETSRSVGAHVKSGGLAVGEFIDDRVQDHTHEAFFQGGYDKMASNSSGEYTLHPDNAATGGVTGARSGTTTEVKAVGVVWAVKARQTGLPIDLKAEVDKEINSLFYYQTINNLQFNIDPNTFNVCSYTPTKPSGYTRIVSAGVNLNNLNQALYGLYNDADTVHFMFKNNSSETSLPNVIVSIVWAK